MRHIILMGVILYSGLIYSQQINFVEQNWNEVQQQAHRENKYIFVDCFATWCQPCKRMEKEVFTNDTVADYFNEHFISFKVQGDQNNKDNDFTKSQYVFADSFSRYNHLASYPTYLFFSPDGNMVFRTNGYQDVSSFIKNAKQAMEPGKVYIDPNKKYDSLLAAHQEDPSNFDSVIYLLRKADELGQTDIYNNLKNEFAAHLAKLDKSLLFTRRNILFMKYFVNEHPDYFVFFLNNEKKIDKTMGRKGYASDIVSNYIQDNEIAPEIKSGKESVTISGKHPIVVKEPDWNSMKEGLSKKYSKYYADRVILCAQTDWAQQHNPFVEFAPLFVKRYRKYGLVEREHQNDKLDRALNGFAWNIVKRVANGDPSESYKSVIDGTIPFMKEIIKKAQNESSILGISKQGWFGDTYACLLYIIGKKDSAIQTEQKAVNILKMNNSEATFADDIIEYEKRLNCMKRNTSVLTLLTFEG
jgi:thioredoxin-related protein